MALHIRLMRDVATSQTDLVRVIADFRATLTAGRDSIGKIDRETWGLDDGGPAHDPDLDVD